MLTDNELRKLAIKEIKKEYPSVKENSVCMKILINVLIKQFKNNPSAAVWLAELNTNKNQ